jgi:hypothetical protein
LNFGEFSCSSSLYILVIKPLSDVYLSKIFFHSVGSLFSLQDHLFCCAEVFQFHVVPFVNPFSEFLSLWLVIFSYFVEKSRNLTQITGTS